MPWPAEPRASVWEVHSTKDTLLTRYTKRSSYHLYLLFPCLTYHILFPKVTRLAKNVNCQFTFGVFTKWDECIRKQQEERGKDKVDVNQTREGYEQKFHKALEGKCEMFFVDVKSEHTDDVSLLFLLFYSMLHAVC